MQIPSSHTASGLPWTLRAGDSRIAQAMAQQHGISELLGGILAGREVPLDHVPRFLNPSLRDDLPDPFHLLDMDKAASRIARAITSAERVAVFGDYDVDGATSTALLHHYFSMCGRHLTPYIPDRLKEGYGPTIAAFEKLINQGATLIVTVDCGTLSQEPIAYAQSRGVDVIVLDHHLSSGALPPAHAVVNPNRVDETSPHTNLAAVGVTFLTLVALNKTLRAAGYFAEGRGEPNLLSLLDLVALGTVCDVMPLTGLNRAFVTQGLKMLGQRRSIGLAALADVARFDETPNVYHLGFLLGPRINAGGRVGEAGLGVELLTTADPDHAKAIAARLDQYNAERQAIETMVLEAALAQAELQANMPVMLLAGEGWHAGVIGIVAGRIKEKYQRPVAVVALENGAGKGSARSVPGADFGAAIHAAQAMGLIEKGGGHAMAAGFSLSQSQLSALHGFLIQRMEAAVASHNEARVKKIDGWLSCPAATLELLDEIALGGPYGLGHPGPRFALRDARIVRTDTLKDKHIRVILTDGTLGGRLTAIAFNAEGTTLGLWLKTAKNLHLSGELKRNSWQGQDSPQFLIDDAAKTA
jgi:single-stranded-DNA-specific exonuclease